MTTTDIETELAALGRPALESLADAIKPGKVAAIRRAQSEWAHSAPVAAARWQELHAELAARQAKAETARRMEAEAERAMDNLGRLVGDVTQAAVRKADPTSALDAARRFELQSSWALTLLGGVGTGKSVAAAWLAHQTLRRGEGVVWLRATELATKSIYGPEADDRSKRARVAALVVLDDLGAEFASGPWLGWLEDVLGYRHSRSLRTVVTANLAIKREKPADSPGLKEYLKDRLFDRLNEGVIVGTGVGSMRRRPSNVVQMRGAQ